MRTDELQTTRGLGELTIVEGHYAAFGRQLDITRGRLLFNNVPLGDPGVDLRAEKEFPDVIAGVNVRGTPARAAHDVLLGALDPAVADRLADPRGRFAGERAGHQRARTARRTCSPRAARSSPSSYGSEVGIEDVALESDLSNETSLVLGKYLSPRLYVSYGISLAEAINTLKLRYTIDDHWTPQDRVGPAPRAPTSTTRSAGRPCLTVSAFLCINAKSYAHRPPPVRPPQRDPAHPARRRPCAGSTTSCACCGAKASRSRSPRSAATCASSAC